jgi:hypothetical protein
MSSTLETRIGVCSMHGTVRAERRLPKVTFPFLVTAPMRYLARRKPFRCPECGAPVI